MHYLYVTLQSGDAGQSFVGMQSTRGQYVWLLDPSIFPASHVSHEIGHAIGLFHEQTRPDRDNYIQVEYNNIQQGWQSQFAPPTQDASTLGTPFDFASIMLYNYQAGSVDPSSPYVPAVVSLWPNISGNQRQWGLGSSDIQGPSRTDIQAVEILYPNPNPDAVAAQAAPAAVALAAPALMPPPPGPPMPPFSPSATIPPPSVASLAEPAKAASLVGNQSLPAMGSSITITITVPYSAGSPTISTSGPAPAPATGPNVVSPPVGLRGVQPPVGLGSAPALAPAGGTPSASRRTRAKARQRRPTPSNFAIAAVPARGRADSPYRTGWSRRAEPSPNSRLRPGTGMYGTAHPSWQWMTCRRFNRFLSALNLSRWAHGNTMSERLLTWPETPREPSIGASR